ncbi:uncharacterized protein HD556DRAFT_638048 [Suillus plorans]|uniref:Uncharacterized protein n=1 Tax=Suillus plorans TaxID=116603 RepID=A0A9P7AMW8_9AGAM|nr:uncharacterized protein HD556DRAFT_638048 [Suillus plorans]KAG1791743.1 hypothetical protein HD556DRAFT_638048 [Suillus plorans]
MSHLHFCCALLKFHLAHCQFPLKHTLVGILHQTCSDVTQSSILSIHSPQPKLREPMHSTVYLSLRMFARSWNESTQSLDAASHQASITTFNQSFTVQQLSLPHAVTSIIPCARSYMIIDRSQPFTIFITGD